MSRAGAPTGPSRRGLLRLAAGSALVSVAARAQQRGELRVMLASETTQHASFVQALRARWSSLTTYPDISASVRGRTPPLAYAAIGPLALQQSLRTPLDAPLIAILVSRQAFARLVEQEGRSPRRITAVFAEASPAQQARVIAAVMRRPATVGALASEQSGYLEPALKAATEAAGLSVAVQAYDAAIGMSRNLLRLAAADALLIHPDSSIFNPANLRELLESTYRRRQPVFGFSEALVQAGTLASAFANSDDLAAHAVELLSAVAEGRLPLPQYPRYWRVAINDSVARSLDIVIDADARSLGDRP